MLHINIAKASRLYQVRIPLYLIGRFWSYVDRPSLKSCWPWIGGLSDYGYGVFEVPGIDSVYAHRLVFAFRNGGLPIGVIVRHSCDNPPCCNPWHLLAGTVADNVRDCIDRQRRGKRTAYKISPEMAGAIVQAARQNLPRRHIAERFGIHVCNVYRVVAKSSKSL